MIRAKHAPRPDAACHSADVLTPTEREADRMPRSFVPAKELVFRDKPMCWGDDPEIRKQLMKLRGNKPCT